MRGSPSLAELQQVCAGARARFIRLHAAHRTLYHRRSAASAMASKLAQTVASQGGARNHVRDFYLEVCRCIPFIQRLHKLEEIASLRELRSAVKSKFNEFKGAKDPRVVDLLIFKGREELECYLMMHKQRHHAISEYIEPYSQRAQRALDAKETQGSAFLDSFYNSQYPQITQKL